MDFNIPIVDGQEIGVQEILVWVKVWYKINEALEQLKVMRRNKKHRPIGKMCD